MSLAAEREILKQIYKLNQARRQMGEFVQHDQQIKDKKTAVTTLRESLKEQRAGISELKLEVATVSTAVTLGCEVKDLLGKKVDCPAEKIGNVIGKMGKNVQNLMSTTNVSVDIVRSQGDIRLVGTLESLNAAISNLEKVISQTEVTIELSALTHKYLASAKITALSQLRERHPNVYFNVSRSDGDVTTTNHHVRVRGIPVDIAAFQGDVLGIELVSAELQLTSRETGLLVGKSGATIAGLVATHQATIDVRRPPKKEEGEAAMTEEPTKVTISGFSDNVRAVTEIIQAMMDAHRDHEASVSIQPITKAVLLLNKGAGIQALHKKVNDAAKEVGDDASTNTHVAIKLNESDITAKGKIKALDRAMDVIREEVSCIESTLIKIKVDPFIIPVIIGKGGQGVKDLKDGAQSVYLDLDRNASEIAVCGPEKGEVNMVVTAVKAVIADNQVHRIRLECGDTSPTLAFSAQFRNFARSAAMKEVKDLVFMITDDAAEQLVLRGKPGNVSKAATLVNAFFENNFVEELVVTPEDIAALLTGGKKSKIVDLASSTGVNLSTDRDRNAIVAKGEKDMVASAMKAVREFLYGSGDIIVNKIALACGELMGVVIGKGGKTKAVLQEKFTSVSIIVHRTDAAITLRGDKAQVEQCHVEIMKLILNASISRTAELSEAQLVDVTKTKLNRKIGQLVPVQVILSTENSNISFRGPSSDVQMALSLLKEQLEGVYESRMQLGSALFQKVRGACRDPAHLDRIEKQSDAKVSLDDKTEDIIFSGSRETVKTAKCAMLIFFDFVFGANMSCCDVAGPAFSMIAKPALLAEVSARTGALVIVDRDLSSILIFSSETEKVKEASTMIQTSLSEAEALVIVWQFGTSEDWLVSSIIGKSGESIKKLRKQCSCTIDVDSKERRMIASAGDAELVLKAKKILDTFVDTSRKECVFIDLSEKDMPAFVGRSGASIKGFSVMHGVAVQITKNQGNNVRITGKEEKVAAAKKAVEAWKATRAEAQKDAEGDESKKMQASHIPVLIGAKGGTIRGLEREFGCKIDIDRTASIVTVKGGSSAKRMALLLKIDKIIIASDEKTAGKVVEEGELDTVSAKENDFDQKTETNAIRPISASPEKPVAIARNPKPTRSTVPMKDSDFPMLVSQIGNSGNVLQPLHGSPWASVEEAKPDEAAVEADTLSEATYVGDVVEESCATASHKWTDSRFI